MVNRVSKQEVVQGAPTVISINNPDAMFLKDNPNVVFKTSSGFLTTDYMAASLASSAGDAVDTTTDASIVVADIPLPPDVPDLADIESISYEEYFDSISGTSKYRATIKIRNSSREKTNVNAVDARIYDPNGIGTPVTTTTTSAYVSNVTWYNATTQYNPFSGTIYVGPSVIGNAQYPSSGTGVPADSVTGPTSNKTKSVWRKTQAEALAAATVNL